MAKIYQNFPANQHRTNNITLVRFDPVDAQRNTPTGAASPRKGTLAAARPMASCDFQAVPGGGRSGAQRRRPSHRLLEEQLCTRTSTPPAQPRGKQRQRLRKRRWNRGFSGRAIAVRRAALERISNLIWPATTNAQRA